MVFNPVQKLTERGQAKYLQRLQKNVLAVNALENEIQTLSDEALRAETARLRDEITAGKTLDDVLIRAFALVREAGVRALGMRHFDVQLLGGMVLHNGSVAEMLTGEGKTLVATLPLYLNALTGENVHLVTANDYLARRDALWMQPLYEKLGLTVGYLQSEQDHEERKHAYSCDITYGTNSEFGFDYLRDHMVVDVHEQVQRSHTYAIVDEVDSILIDEARTPLIISGSPENAEETYYEFARLVNRMQADEHYEFDEKKHIAYPTDLGVDMAEQMLGIDNLWLPEHVQLINHLNQAIRAKSLYHRDKEYIVAPDEDGEMAVKIVDEHTGRIMEGRRWSDGLHQAVEAKEGVAIQAENITVATITIQNYFRLYKKLAGMTGTATTEAVEFKEIYGLDVVPIPPNRPVARHDYADKLFQTEQGKFNAMLVEIVNRHMQGQPILVGTVAVETSEKISRLLKQQGIRHELLNAKNHEREAEIIAQAGERGAVTIATNMAGRGVDIKIDDTVKALGGLYVMGTERHESRRIDNQLRGRSGRQGDPGETQFYLSGEDNLLRLFAGDRLKTLMSMTRLPEDQPLTQQSFTKYVAKAQKQLEEYNFTARKDVLKYDDVLNRQRQNIYQERQSILTGLSYKDQAMSWLADELDNIADTFLDGPYAEEWDLDGYLERIATLFPISVDPQKLSLENLSRDELINHLLEDAKKHYEQKEALIGEDKMREIERILLLQLLDQHWREHLDQMDYIRQGIGLRGLAQKNPLTEYTTEGFLMFEQMQGELRSDYVEHLLRLDVTPFMEEPVKAPEKPRTVLPKVGRNDPCPCGSGKKYKHCHGR